MTTSELIRRLQNEPGDREIEILIGDADAKTYPVKGVGAKDPKNGEPTKTIILGFL